jgi:hypothetical protein
MRQTTLFAACAAALILACVAGWALFDTQARVATPTTVQIDPFTLMTSAKQLPTDAAAAAALILVCVWGWTCSTGTQAAVQIDPFQTH